MRHRAWPVTLHACSYGSRNMAENNISRDSLPVLEVRVINPKRKTSYRVRRLNNFPVVETLVELEDQLQILLPDIKNLENCQVGYVLERNKKYSIMNDYDLKSAYNHFRAGYQMWLDPGQNIPPELTKTQMQVRKLQTFAIHADA